MWFVRKIRAGRVSGRVFVRWWRRVGCGFGGIVWFGEGEVWIRLFFIFLVWCRWWVGGVVVL